MQKTKRPFNNRNLFSNHYLENQIKAAPEWGRSDHEAVFEEIRKVYERESAFVANLSESQLEDRLFRSLFAVILPSYEVQGATKSREFPDYAFFPDREARDRKLGRRCWIGTTCGSTCKFDFVMANPPFKVDRVNNANYAYGRI